MWRVLVLALLAGCASEAGSVGDYGSPPAATSGCFFVRQKVVVQVKGTGKVMWLCEECPVEDTLPPPLPSEVSMCAASGDIWTCEDKCPIGTVWQGQVVTH